MTPDQTPTRHQTWIRTLSMAIALGIALGYLVGLLLHSPILGLKYGAIIALIFLVLRLRWPTWTPALLISLSLGTIAFTIVYPVPQPLLFTETGRQVLPEILRRLESWEFMAEYFRQVYSFLAIAAVIMSILVSIDLPELQKYRRWIALTAAICFAMISAFDIGQKANNTRDAWRLLNTAVMRFQVDSSFTANDLIDQYSQGEQIIGGFKSYPR